MQLLEVKLYFDDAGRFHPSTQDVLLSRQVVCRSNAAKAVKKTTAQHDRTLSTTCLEKLGYLNMVAKQAQTEVGLLCINLLSCKYAS